MDRGAWWVIVHGVTVRHDRVTNTLTLVKKLSVKHLFFLITLSKLE